LLSLGDRPEAVFPEAKEWLRCHGFQRTLDYVAHISDRLLEETSLFPHSNPGLMARSDLERLKQPTSLGGAESTSAALFAPEAHEDAVDKPGPTHRLSARLGARFPYHGILVASGNAMDIEIACYDPRIASALQAYQK
jgi:hypothetical protein